MSPITLDVPHIPRPQKNAKLFIRDGPSERFSMIGWGGASHQYVLYMEGYKTAADELVEQALGTKNVMRLDTFIFPILFLYRHFIELELKWVFLAYSDGDSSVKKSVLDKVKHNLLKIWKEIEPILLRDITPEEQQDVNIVKDYIEQFHKLDKSSFSFRYAITMTLDQIIKSEQRINLPNLRQRMDELYHFFSGVDTKLWYMQNMEKVFRSAVGDTFNWNDT